VLLVNDRLGYEDRRLHGSGRLMIWWTRALLRKGVDVTAVILRAPGELGRAVLDEGLPFVFLDRSPFDPRTLFDFIRLIRRYRIDVLHLQGLGGTTFGRLAARLMGKPTIVHVHADQRKEPKGYPWYAGWLDRLLASHTTRVLSISSAIAGVATEVNGFRRAQIEVLPNPVDLERFHPPSGAERVRILQDLRLFPPGGPVAVCVARFDPIKGVDVLVNAWPRVLDSFPTATLLLVGDGPERKSLQAHVDGLRGRDRIRFLGYHADVERLLRCADVAVVPSRSEGFSLAALESMATGLPVVATRVGGIPEIVSECVNGYLVQPEDPEAMARAIVRALSLTEEQRADLRQAALATAADHDLGLCAERLAGVYREVASL